MELSITETKKPLIHAYNNQQQTQQNEKKNLLQTYSRTKKTI